MITQKQEAYKILSYLLAYPTLDRYDCLPEMRSWADTVGQAGEPFRKAIDTLMAIPLDELQEHYVATFDFSNAHSLYLTARECGENRDRGMALVELVTLLKQGGMQEVGNELADFLPLLFEFIASKPDSMGTSNLERRIAVACGEIQSELASEDPYLPAFAAARYVLPEVSEDEWKTAAASRDNKPRDGDPGEVDDMPYPLAYE